MSSREPAPAPESTEPERERRAQRITPGSLRWFKSLLYRPLGLERRNKQLHITFVERRRSPEVIQAESLARLREELRTRLVTLEDQATNISMQHLVCVHDELGRQGWPGVQALDSRVLRKACQQAKVLHDLEPSKRLEKLVHHLRLLQTAAEVREDKAERNQWLAAAASAAAAAAAVAADSAGVTQPGPQERVSAGAELEISEASTEDYEATQRVWEATNPSELEPLQPMSDQSSP